MTTNLLLEECTSLKLVFTVSLLSDQSVVSTPWEPPQKFNRANNPLFFFAPLLLVYERNTQRIFDYPNNFFFLSAKILKASPYHKSAVGHVPSVIVALCYMPHLSFASYKFISSISPSFSTGSRHALMNWKKQISLLFYTKHSF